jgi:predicted MFS family arabinose efflux permease
VQQSPTFARLLGVVRRNPAFRRLYAANAISQMGDWFNVVALYSLLLELTGKGEAVALALLTRLVPLFLVSPAAGVLADRISRRAILIASDLLRAALVLCLLFVRRPDQVWIAYAVMTAHSIVSAFFEPAQAAIFPGLVPPEELVYASTLENSLWSVTLALGSALGGVVLAAVGRDAAFAFDALSFVGSALLIRGLPRGTPRWTAAAGGTSIANTRGGSAAAGGTSIANTRGGSAAAGGTSIANTRGGSRDDAEVLEAARPPREGLVNLLGLRELREGIRYVATHRRVRALLAVKASFGLTLGGVIVLLAFFGERVFGHGNGAGIAILWTARGAGSFVGPFLAFRLVGHDEPSLRRGILYAFVLLVVCYCGFALSPHIALAAVALALANAGGSILWTYASALLQQIVPDEIRGRVAAADMCGMTLTMSTSTLVVGKLLDQGVPARALMAACGLVALVPIAFWRSQEAAFQSTGSAAEG